MTQSARAHDQMSSLTSRDIKYFRTAKPFAALDNRLLSLSPEDTGIVIYEEQDRKGRKFSFVDIPAVAAQGFVPTIYIESKLRPEYGDPQIVSQEVISIMIPQDIRQEISTQTTFERSIEAELLLWHENALTLELPRDVSDRIATQMLRRSIVENILLGCHHEGTFAELNKPNFSWQSLLNSASQPAEKDSGSGIYASRYYNFAGDPAKKDVARVDSASVLATRVRSHIKHRTDNDWTSERTHLTQARQARHFEHRTICYIEDSCVRLIAKQVFVSLFELYSPTILEDDPITDNVFDGTADESMIEETRQGEMADVSRKARTYSRVKAMCRINAIQLLEVSRRARAISKWGGGLTS